MYGTDKQPKRCLRCYTKLIKHRFDGVTIRWCRKCRQHGITFY